MKIFAIRYFLATLAMLNTKAAITHYLVFVSIIVLNSASFGVFEVHCRQNNKNIIFTPNFATFYFEIAVKWSKSRI